jgi:hypothetical protein
VIHPRQARSSGRCPSAGIRSVDREFRNSTYTTPSFFRSENVLGSSSSPNRRTSSPRSHGRAQQHRHSQSGQEPPGHYSPGRASSISGSFNWGSSPASLKVDFEKVQQAECPVEGNVRAQPCERWPAHFRSNRSCHSAILGWLLRSGPRSKRSVRRRKTSPLSRRSQTDQEPCRSPVPTPHSIKRAIPESEPFSIHYH